MHFRSIPRHAIYCVIGMPSMVRLFDEGLRAWVSRRLSRRRARHGKTPSLKELLDPYAGIVWITSLFSMSGTYAERFANISVITIPVERICR